MCQYLPAWGEVGGAKALHPSSAKSDTSHSSSKSSSTVHQLNTSRFFFFFDLDVIFNRQDLSPRFRVQSSKKERLCLTQFCLTSVHKKEDKTGGRNNCLWDQHTWYKEKVSENAVLLLKN